MGCPLPLTCWLGLVFSDWGLTPVLPILLWSEEARRPVGPEAAVLPFIFLATGLHSQIFSFYSTAKGYDKTLPGQWHHSSGLSPALGMCP